MKLNKKKSSAIKTTRKNHFNVTGKKLTKLISSPLTKSLKQTYENKIKKFPVRPGDTVEVFKGEFKGRICEVIKINRVMRKLHLEGCDKQEDIENNNEKKTVPANIDPSNCRINQFGDSKDRMLMVEKKLERINKHIENNKYKEMGLVE
ncbi:60S ribosomal protein L26-like 1 [Cucumispora dikerogammari]|nr:60S ribosomal protein L26-like 1 [Cucumispora dikerogammari]